MSRQGTNVANLQLKLTCQTIRQRQHLNLTASSSHLTERSIILTDTIGSNINQLNYNLILFCLGIRFDQRQLTKMSFLLNMIHGKFTTIPSQEEDCTDKVVIITGGNGGN